MWCNRFHKTSDFWSTFKRMIVLLSELLQTIQLFTIMIFLRLDKAIFFVNLFESVVLKEAFTPCPLPPPQKNVCLCLFCIYKHTFSYCLNLKQTFSPFLYLLNFFAFILQLCQVNSLSNSFANPNQCLKQLSLSWNRSNSNLVINSDSLSLGTMKNYKSNYLECLNSPKW